MTNLTFPEPIAVYFEADKHGDAAAVARCFAKSAVVKDEGQTHSGRAAIQEWKTGASAKYSYTSEPLSVEREDDRYIVISRLTGNFPGSPVELSYAFRLERVKIAALEITA
jgi:hypothetical protein